MRPVHDGNAPRIVHHFAANLNAIAGLHRDSRRYRDVVDDFHAPGRGLRVEGFMFAVSALAEEEVRRPATRA